MNKKKSDEKIDNLKWIRVFTPDHLPKYLVEQVRDRDYSIEDFYKFHTLNCITQKDNTFTVNPFNHLYVLANQDNIVKGFLWFTIDPLAKNIFIQTFSIDKEYWFKGYAMRKVSEHVKEIRKKAKLNKIYWITKFEKHSKYYGFKPSSSILMEYDPSIEEKET